MNYEEQEEGITLREHHLKSYKKFSRITKYPVFIVIGVNGWPNKPKKMFLFPLNRAKIFLSKRELQTYSKDPTKKFTIGKGIIK